MVFCQWLRVGRLACPYVCLAAGVPILTCHLQWHQRCAQHATLWRAGGRWCEIW